MKVPKECVQRKKKELDVTDNTMVKGQESRQTLAVETEVIVVGSSRIWNGYLDGLPISPYTVRKGREKCEVWKSIG